MLGFMPELFKSATALVVSGAYVVVAVKINGSLILSCFALS